MPLLSRRDVMVGGATFVVGACAPTPKPRASRLETLPPSPPPVSFESAKPFHDFSSDLSSDGRFLAIGAGSPNGEDTGGPVAVWDLVARRIVRRRRIDGLGLGLVLAGRNLLRFTPSDRLLIANTNTNNVTVLDARAPDLAVIGNMWLDETRDSGPRAVALPGEREVFTFGERGPAVVSIRGTHEARSRDVRWLDADAFPSVHELAARQDGLVVGAGAEIRAIDSSSGKLRYAVRPPWKHFNPVAFSPDASFLAGATSGGVAFIDTASGRTLAQHAEGSDDPESIVWDARGRRAAVVWRTFDVFVYDAFAPLCRLGVRPRHQDGILAPDLRSFAFSPDGSRGVATTMDGELAIFELAARARELHRVSVVPDAKEWGGVHWAAGDQVVVVTSRELIFVDATTGKIAERAPLGFWVTRDLHDGR